MKTNKFLLLVVILLASALVAESIYVWRLKQKKAAGADFIKQQVASDLLPVTRRTPSVPFFSPSNDPDPFSLDSRWESRDPFEEMERIQQRMNRLFRESFNRGSFGKSFAPLHSTGYFEPDADLRETAEHYLLKIDLPGMDKDKINVEVKGSYLTVSGERKIENEESGNQGFYRIERSFGAFSRTVPLPADADPNDVTAEYHNGVLTVKVAKLKSSDANPAGSTIPIQ